jgi:oligopeptide/dipeptide ABC transporter ATP-binding protein
VTSVPLLRVENLVTVIDAAGGAIRAVDGVSLDIAAGETVGLVGESGCGKSVLALSILGLLPRSQARVAEGRVLWRGADLAALREPQLRRVRGNEIAMVFQEPMTSLNPVLAVGAQIEEAIRVHESVSREAARARAVDLLGRVGIPNPAARARDYPHQLSGGMRQRVMIAMALSCGPSLLIADEPTTALDVTVQAGILDLLGRLQEETGMAVLLITHDMGVVAETARRVLVMYAGQIVEEAGVGDLFGRPLHPYTKALLESVPRLDAHQERLRAIPGAVPDPRAFPAGCRFHPRCSIAVPECRGAVPPLETKAASRRARCFEVPGPVAGARA